MPYHTMSFHTNDKDWLQAKCIPAALGWNENVCQAKLSNEKKKHKENQIK